MLIRPDSFTPPTSGARPNSDTLPTSASLPNSDALTVHFEGRAIAARPGDSIAAALLASGITVTRLTPVTGAARGPYCMMGACFDCLAVVDGRPSVQTCMTQVRDGMRIDRQDGARGLAIEAVVFSLLSDPSPLSAPSPPSAPSPLLPSPQPSSASRPEPSRGGEE
jgi:hypothetical protein